jgi:hypothetical protein
MALLETIQLIHLGNEMVLQSTNDKVPKIKKRPTGDEIESMLKEHIKGEEGKTLHELLVEGLVELCKVKPVGIDAVEWLGEWLIANNPHKPRVDCIIEEAD